MKIYRVDFQFKQVFCKQFSNSSSLCVDILGSAPENNENENSWNIYFFLKNIIIIIITVGFVKSKIDSEICASYSFSNNDEIPTIWFSRSNLRQTFKQRIDATALIWSRHLCNLHLHIYKYIDEMYCRLCCTVGYVYVYLGLVAKSALKQPTHNGFYWPTTHLHSQQQIKYNCYLQCRNDVNFYLICSYLIAC